MVDIPRICFSLMSGGLDSGIALFKIIHEFPYDDIKPIFFNRQWNGKGHNSLEKEREYIMRQLSILGITSTVEEIKIPFVWREAAQEKTQNFVFPEGRNLIFLSIASAIASTYLIIDHMKHNADIIVGFLSNDGKDGSKQFLEKMNQTILEAINVPSDSLRIIAPLIDMSKSQVINYAVSKNRFDLLQNSWSCYSSGNEHCGECDNCKKRKEAFRIADVKDPTKYQK